MIYTPPIEQSDWSEFTSHGTNVYIYIYIINVHIITCTDKSTCAVCMYTHVPIYQLDALQCATCSLSWKTEKHRRASFTNVTEIYSSTASSINKKHLHNTALETHTK